MLRKIVILYVCMIMSDFYDVSLGLKQGKPLSLLLFLLFVSNISDISDFDAMVEKDL